MKTLLQGKPYVRADRTDISKTFARIKRELKKERESRLERVFRLPAKRA